MKEVRMMEMAEANPFRMLSAYFITKEMINPKMAWNKAKRSVGRCLYRRRRLVGWLVGWLVG